MRTHQPIRWFAPPDTDKYGMFEAFDIAIFRLRKENHMDTITTDERPFDYALVYSQLILKAGKAKLSDKDAGKMLKVSERQIRKARMEGMDAAMADLFAVRVGSHPVEIYGFDAWCTAEVLADADDGDAEDSWLQKQLVGA